MSGQDGNRGYLIQSVVALLESLSRSDWEGLTLEPTFASDKIDISWYGPSTTRACQVKSSINQINLPDARKWAAELEAQSTADEFTLILVGPCSSSVARMGRHGKVAVPCPKNLDFEGLLGLAAHLLDGFLTREKIKKQSPNHRELMVRALVTELSVFASDGAPIERIDFINLLKGWVKEVAAPADLKWELIDFSHQRGIENAIAGKRLGPADVDQCPEFTICGQVVTELKRSHWYSIVGQPGCGKSITAWQAAKEFHDHDYSVWRPRCSAGADELLRNLPTASPSLLVIDDAQQFGSGFVERLSEHSCETLKVVFTCTLADIVTPNPSCISPASGVDKLNSSILERRDEILPIVQRFDDRVGDSYMDVSFERRVDDCARQKTPWEFFWVLRGGWQTAHTEYESLKQVPNAHALLTTTAFRQISSCDAGISRDHLFRIAGGMGLTVDETDRAISHLGQLGLILISDDTLRTKHISYAYRIAEASLSDGNHGTWQCSIDMLLAALLDGNASFQGVYWLLEAIRMTDAVRSGHGEKLRSTLEPLLGRCRGEWLHSEWAVGCVSYLSRLSGLSLEEMVSDEELLLKWLTAGTGRIARFGRDIANDLINRSDIKGRPETTDVAKSLFEKVDWTRLVELANGLTLNDFYSFGDLLSRLVFYRPSWSDRFLDQLDWQRTLGIILDADAEHCYAVDQLVGALSQMGTRDVSRYSLRYVEDIVPFVVRAIREYPASTIESMHNVFWSILGLTPSFLRSGEDPDKRQLQIAGSIVEQLDPADFAFAMKNIIPRDMEELARSLSIIHEVNGEFISQVAPLVPVEEFHITAKRDWATQSAELTKLIPFFCIGTEHQPARNWITCNEEVIEGPLEPLLAAIAPQVALNFHRAGKGVSLVGRHQHRWQRTVWAISSIADIDESVAINIVTDQFEELEGKLYALVSDPLRYVVLFFRLLDELSRDLFLDFVGRLDMDDPRAIKTIHQLAKSQPEQRANYEKMARLALRIGGAVGAVGESFLMRLKEALGRCQDD